MDDLERAVASQIDAAGEWGHVERLSTLDRTGGTPGEREAAEYVMAKLAEYGVPATLHEYDCLISHPLEGRLEILDPEPTTIYCRPRAFAASTPEEGLVAEMIFVPSPADSAGKGGMIFASGGEVDDYAGLPVAGKIVLTTTGGTDGVKNAQDVGAAAHCHLWPSGEDVIHEMDVSPIWGTPTPETIGHLPRIPAVGIKNADGERLKELCRRGTVRARLKAGVSTSWMRVPLPVATVQGSETPQQFVLVGGHLCSWYQGVTDNATGVACLLELARVLQRNRNSLRRSVRFVWWTGHEQGHYGGSTWYADHAFADLRRHGLVCLNIDSPGVRGAAVWDCRYVHAEVERFMDSVVREVTGQQPNLRRPFKAGDHTFLGIGLPSLGAFQMLPVDSPDRALVGGSGGGWWWQSPEDTLDKADPRVLADHTRLYLAILWRLCTAERLPFEFVTAAGDFERLLMELSEAVGDRLDLGPALYWTVELRVAAERLEALKAGVSGGGVAALNAGLMRVSRILNPVLYTLAGEYDQDLALQLPMLPGLQPARRLARLAPSSDEHRLLHARLVRERNRAEDALYRATEEITRLVQELS